MLSINKENYDPQDVDWIEFTMISSNYEIEIDVMNSNHARHRKRFTNGPWIKGWPKDVVT